MIVRIFEEKKKFLKKISKHERVSGSKFECATSIGAHCRKLKSFKGKLTDSAAGVAPSTYPIPISHKS
jgi:hypothetical protein